MRAIITICLIVLLQLGGCSGHEQETFSVLGETITLPITISEARTKYHLDRSYPGAFFRTDTATCKTLSVCFWAWDLFEKPDENVWGVNIVVDTSRYKLQSVVKQVEKELDVSFELDESDPFFPYYYADRGNLRLGIGSTGANPFVKVQPTRAKPACFTAGKLDKITLFMGYGLTKREFAVYVSSNGTHTVLD